MRLIELALFLAPFGAFIVWRFTLAQPAPSGAIIGVALFAIALLAASLIWFSEREAASPASQYVPAHLDAGRVVPGHYEAR
jgi:hypothetical protein